MSWKKTLNSALLRTTGYQLTRQPPEVGRTAAAHGARGRRPAASTPAASPLVSRPVDLVLHVGMDKTGTSSVQGFLRDNREQLRDNGVLFPVTPGAVRHELLGLFAKPDAEVVMSPEWPRQGQDDIARFRREFRRQLTSEIEESGLDRVLLTDEVLFGCSEPTFQRLGRLAGRLATNVRVVAYLRRQDDHMVGRYQEQVKVGRLLRLRDWAQQDMSDLYDYDARLRRLARLTPATELVVRRYERASFAGGSIYQDFLDACAIPIEAGVLTQGPDLNRSLDAESVEFIRLLNLYRVEREGATPGQIDNRALSMRLLKVSHGPALSLPDDQFRAFMEQWSESNARVARQYLDDTDGELFRAPRKEHVTIEQCLDPARIDHFVTLLDLPERLHQPLRQIAEREASSW